MQIDHTVYEDHLTVKMDGRLDAVTAPQLQKEVEAILPHMHSVDLDMEDVDYISSAGLRSLMALHRKAAAQQAVMKVLNISPAVREIFTVTGFDNVLNLG